MYIYKDSPGFRPLLLCKVNVVNNFKNKFPHVKLTQGEHHLQEHISGSTSFVYPQGVPAKPKEHPQPKYNGYFLLHPAKPKIKEGLNPQVAGHLQFFLVLFRVGATQGGALKPKLQVNRAYTMFIFRTGAVTPKIHLVSALFCSARSMLSIISKTNFRM